jgi:hypothetical protein
MILTVLKVPPKSPELSQKHPSQLHIGLTTLTGLFELNIGGNMMFLGVK